MGVIQRVLGGFLRNMTERGARDMTLAELRRRLEETGHEVAERIGGAADTPRNRKQADHVIGIERWAQRRLRIALGEPVISDEYDGYRSGAPSIEALRTAWEQTRRETLEIVDAIERAGVSPDRTMPHNDMGEVTVRGWLNYLLSHATRESKRLR